MPTGENIWGRRTSLLPSLSWKKSSEIEIVLDGDNDFVRSYSTFDEITGHVNLRFEKDTCIDDMVINFQGTTTTWIEKIATTSPTMGRTTGKHTFLRVRQPIDENCLPEFNKALAGQTYTIPFKFVVPDRILDFICSHKVDSDAVKDQHLQLPPSMGNPMLAGKGNTLMDDLSPVMAKIVYSIRVALLKASPNVRKPEVIEEEIGIRIIPAREELPPISMDLLSDVNARKYCLRKEKNVRKGLFKIGKKQGRLTAETMQPASLKLHHPSKETDEPIATMTTVQLRFDPVSEDEQPPSLNNMTNKLKIYTFFGASAWSYFPVPEGYDIYSTLHSSYPDTVDLSTRNLSNVEWTKHAPNSSATVPARHTPALPSAYERRSSKMSSTSIPSSADTHGSRSTIHGSFARRASTFSNASSDSSATSSDEESNSNGSGSEGSSSVNLTKSKKTNSISPSEAYNPSLSYYTASIVVPITLPTSSISLPNSLVSSSPATGRRPSTASINSQSQDTSSHTSSKRSKPISFIPSFYSCLVNRVYALDLSISAQSTPTINLRAPIQISLPYPDRNAVNTMQTSASHAIQSSVEAPPAWADPFSTSTNVDLANDEALARALSQSYDDDDLSYLPSQIQMQSKQRRNTTQLDDVPEYEATSSTNTTSNISPQTRHASIAVTANDDLPPEYDSHFNVRRVSAARRAAASTGHESSASNMTTTSTASASAPAPATTPVPNAGENSRRRRSGLFGSSGSSSASGPSNGAGAGAGAGAGTEGGRVTTGHPRKGSIARGLSVLL